MELFEKASRLKFRFMTNRGLVSTEELWDMPLVSRDGFAVDDVAKLLHKQIKNDDDQSFVLEGKKIDEIASLKLDLVKYVIKVRLDEAEIALQAKDREKKKKKIMALIAKKEDETMEAVSIDKLREMLEAL